MYEAFYGLTEKPFNLTPDPRFLFLSEKHKEAFAHLLFGIKNRTGFIMVSGEIGTGKTTICRSLLSQLDPDIEIAFIFNPRLSPIELLRKINEDFGIQSQGESLKDLIDELNEYLLDRASNGKNCVLVIDEAQNLDPSVLEQIRLLSNLETETQKLLQIILIGQPELAHSLQLPELRQLNQRITARYHLKPLDREETLQYIAYRLRVAGGRKKITFTRSAVGAVYRLSRGTPRVINAICDRALLIGYTKEIREITAPIIRRAAKEIRGERLKAKRQLTPTLKRFLPNPALVATAVFIFILAQLFPIRWVQRETLAPSAVPTLTTDKTASQLAAPKSSVPVVRTDTANGELASALNIVEAATQRRSTPTPQLAPFASWLAQTNPSDALAIGISGILRAWNLAPVDYPESDKIDSVTRFAETNGFACDLLTSSIDQLVALNLPALLNVECADKHLWVGLVAAEGDTVSVYADGYKTHRVSRQELDSHYAGTALVFWRDPQPNASVLSKGMKGKDVVKLQHDLKVANLLAGAPTGMFGDETVRVISELQEETGLTVDGLVGRQVRMALCGRLPDPRVPSLSSSDAAPQVASPNPDGEPSQRGVPWLATQEDSGQPEMMMFGVEDSAAVGIPQILSTPLDPPPPNDQTTAERAASS